MHNEPYQSHKHTTTLHSFLITSKTHTRTRTHTRTQTKQKLKTNGLSVMNGCRVDLVPAVMRGQDAGSLTWLRASMKMTRGLVLGLDSMLQHIMDAESSSFGMLQFCPNTHTCKSNTPWSQYLCAPNKIFRGVAVMSITCMGIQHQRVCTLRAPNAESLGVLKFCPAGASL